MDVRIGVTNSAKELVVDLPEGADAPTVKADIEASLSKDEGVLWLTDERGRQVGVPVAKISYVEIGSPKDDRRIGFGGGA